MTSSTSGSPASPARHGPIRAGLVARGDDHADRARCARGRERRPARAAAREPGQHDGARARLGEAEQHRPADWHSSSPELRRSTGEGVDLNDTPELAAYREEVRAWLEEHKHAAPPLARRRRRPRRRAPVLAAGAGRGPPGRGHVAGGVRRRRARPAPAGGRQPGDRPRRRAGDLRHHRRGHARPDADRARVRGAEAAPPRARCSPPTRSGASSSPSRPRARTSPACRPAPAGGGRRLAPLGPEGVDDQRPARRVRPPARPHEPRRAQAQGPDHVRRPDGRRGRHDPAAAPDLGRGALQRGLPRRRAARAGRRGRAGRRRLGRRHDHADVRARDDRPRRRGLRLARGPLRPRAAARRGVHARRGDPSPLRRDRHGVPRAALHGLPDADRPAARADPRRRGRAGQGDDDPRGDRRRRPDRRRARARRPRRRALRRAGLRHARA